MSGANADSGSMRYFFLPARSALRYGARRCRRLLFAGVLSLLSSAWGQVAPEIMVKIASPVTTICWNGDDSLFALGERNAIVIRDADTLETAWRLPFSGVSGLCFSEEATGDIILGISDHYLGIWNLSAGEKAAHLLERYHEEFGALRVGAMAFSSTSDLVAVSLSDGSIRLYFKLRYTRVLSTPAVLSGHAEEAHCLAFSPDDRYLASASKDGTVRVWRTEDGSLVRVFTSFKGMSTPVAFTPDSAHIIACFTPGVVSVVPLEGRERDAVLSVEPEVHPVKSFHATADGESLVVLDGKDAFQFYDKNGVFVGSIPSCNASRLMSYAFNSHDTQVLVGYEDGSVYRRSCKVLANEQTASEGETEVVVGAEEEVAERGDETEARAEIDDRRALFSANLKRRISAFQAGASVALLNEKTTGYWLAAGPEFDWRGTTMATAPVYLGLGARFMAALPSSDYPAQDTLLNGDDTDQPYLFFGELFLPLGVEIPVNEHFSVISEIAFLAKVSFLMNPGVATSTPEIAFGGRARTGIVIRHVQITVGAEYDTVWGFVPEVSVMAHFRIRKN